MARWEDREAYAFNALIRLAEEVVSEKRSTVRNMTLLRVDLEALQRGEVRGDELCEISGVGPIAVSAARELVGESVLQLVITKGVDVLNVTHLGRSPTAAQRVALLFRQPVCCMRAVTGDVVRSTIGRIGPAPGTPEWTSATRCASRTTTSRRTKAGLWSKARGNDLSLHLTILGTRTTGLRHERG